jgi:hypothetical protein
MAKNVCVSCGTEEDSKDYKKRGANYEAKSSGGTVVKFWMCNPCAIPLGPPQGPITVQDPTLKV